MTPFEVATENRDELIIAHIPLVKHIVGRFPMYVGGPVDREDLYGFGMLGLIAAANSWDRMRGVQFSTHAYSRIRGSILDELRKVDFLPRGMREKVRQVEQALEAIAQRSSGRPSPEQIAVELDLQPEELDEILLAAKSTGQVSISDREAHELHELLSDPRCSDPLGSAEHEEMKSLLVEAICSLPEQEQTVINLYYAEGLLLREISELLGLSESRVSQIHTRALFRLNRALSAAAEQRSGR
jgi:RNA polymerase sigma factor for flagellar operon FliA